VPNENEVCVRFIYTVFSGLKKNSQVYDLLKRAVLNYFNENILESYAKDRNREVSYCLSECFNTFKMAKTYEEGLTFFRKINERISHEKYFVNSFAFELYFAYQVKKFETVERYLTSHSCEMMGEKYSESNDYCLFNFYRGLIFLSRRVRQSSLTLF
jgi:hypothetical protein